MYFLAIKIVYKLRFLIILFLAIITKLVGVLEATGSGQKKVAMTR